MRVDAAVARRAAACAFLGALVLAGTAVHRRLAAAAEAPVPPSSSAREGELGGARVAAHLRAAGVPGREAEAAAAALATATDARRLMREDAYRVALSSSGTFLHLTLWRRTERVVVSRGPGGRLRATARPLPMTVETRAAAGLVRGSLWASMEEAGVPVETIFEFAEAFRWTTDFLTETRDGDRFAVVWTERRSPGGRYRSAETLGGSYRGRAAGDRFAIRFDGEFFDRGGESLRRRFLRAPLRFARVSSGFNPKRRHPILRVNRPHHGTDYAAPRGTPVASVADGVVTVARRERGFGNVVKIRHDGVYTTLYGHLNAFARGVRAGTRVKQGQVVGFVGSTGLATGPHLHFQIEKRGRWVDFLRLDLPFARPVPRARRSAFAAARDSLARALAAAEASAAARLGAEGEADGLDLRALHRGRRLGEDRDG